MNIFHHFRPSPWRLLFHQHMVVIIDSVCKTSRTQCDNSELCFGQNPTILAPLISDIFIQVMLFSPSNIWQLRCRSPPWSTAAGLPGSTWHTVGRWEGRSRNQPEGSKNNMVTVSMQKIRYRAAVEEGFLCSSSTVLMWLHFNPMREADCIPLCNELICNHAQLCESLFNTGKITIWFIFNPISRRHREVLLSCISCLKLVVQTLRLNLTRGALRELSEWTGLGAVEYM